MTYLLLVETAGNQAYIYDTNKLAENIGASELTFRTGSQWVLEALDKIGGPAGIWDPNPQTLRENIAMAKPHGGIRLLLSTSGKALVLCEQEQQARQVLAEVTERAIQEAPGLDLGGAIVQIPSTAVVEGSAEPGRAHAAVKAVHRRYALIRNTLPAPVQRFAHSPITQPCAHSGKPSAALVKIPPDAESPLPLSSECQAKRKYTHCWQQRIQQVFDNHNPLSAADGPLGIAKNIRDLETQVEDLTWLAVVHADGNGLGQIFTDFDQFLGGQDYFPALRDFSLALDAVTETAFYRACQALKVTANKNTLPIVPLLLGGDDLTVVMDGNHALPFTRAFLTAFEQETAACDTVAAVAERAFGVRRLGICAGVAIVKPHFPFFSAYALAESLIQSAKQVKQRVLTAEGHPHPCSALDFHILYDGNYTSLAAIREQRLTRRESDGSSTRLFAGPYVITEASALQRAEDSTWARRHHIAGLMSRVEAFMAQDQDGRRLLPAGQMHAVREALFFGREEADRRLRDMASACPSQLITALCEEQSLFRPDGGGVFHETRFLDALTSAPFWYRQEEQ